MDPINIIISLNIIATFGANVTGAKRGLKSTVSEVKEKPKTFLQKFPPVVSMLSLVALILAVFQIGTLDYLEEYSVIRYIGLAVYLVFSWVQVWSFKTLGDNYSQDIMIKKNHELITKGPFKIIRHPQYLCQILLDLGATAATFGYIVGFLALVEIPIYIMRASLEDKLLAKYFSEKFSDYKKKSGFMIPFIG
ncbi:MAG: isoprenylcysteine carboxylmethyltransferase family protein [Ignavibacteriaceae bacterium]|jgi:protein-S-isoprenylcysteine O-methyltransferase Ste14|nr:isoprenylcysteine carboxylmethyltransferase family protein [Ignavibacteriaceae bacterium]MCU0365537.1 isoprenylcysteine carboxylmethyltransferase family protein [Ignavibacteriaceae bacterium]MCU0406781.1 isoprenylcysteine carboxylmethyltransferase family protein [Ignavibacteriaceae bacterium]MCU0415192.1 isoprenylcysteine carboxylmethyltransferase family protein [Ignavibacteriaceae bacterium]